MEEEEDIIQLQMAREAEERFWEELRAGGGSDRPRALAASAAALEVQGKPSLDLGRKDTDF